MYLVFIFSTVTNSLSELLSDAVGIDKVNFKPKDTRTEEQKEALVDMLEFFKIAHPEAVIYGHRDFASKACPSFDAKNEYKNL